MSELSILAPTQQSSLNKKECIETIFTLSPLASCNALTLAFVQSLSDCLLKSEQAKSLPELVALGFWLRRANIKKIISQQTDVINKALGTVIHFTPTNVDTMFVYSWVCSLIMGNNNIVRVASSDSATKNTLLNELNRLYALVEYNDIAQRNIFVTYPKASQNSAELSLLADARVIWGGDASVNIIRALPTQPRCRDICFADRYSAALINGEQLNEQQQVSELATLLWRDTQPHAQQACSSPRVVFWLGNTAFQKSFFEQINQLARQQNAEPQKLNNHLVVSQMMQSTGLALHPLVQEYICALPVEALREEFLEWHLGNGLFLIKYLTNLEEIADSIDNKLQTLSYWGLTRKKMLKLVSEPSIKGLDRIVPVGQALEFTPDWDGYRLLTDLSRHITVG